MVFVGGGLGSICRFWVGDLLKKYSVPFPSGTFAANLISCIILGALIEMTLKQQLSNNQKLLLLTGFCGGFSTFSTFSSEIFQLLQSGKTTLALTYASLSLLLGIVGIFVGIKLVQTL